MPANVFMIECHYLALSLSLSLSLSIRRQYCCCCCKYLESFVSLQSLFKLFSGTHTHTGLYVCGRALVHLLASRDMDCVAILATATNCSTSSSSSCCMCGATMPFSLLLWLLFGAACLSEWKLKQAKDELMKRSHSNYKLSNKIVAH